MRLRLFIFFFALSASSAEQRRSENEIILDSCNDTKSETMGYFSWPDYSVLGTMLIVSCLIGTFYGFFTKKHESSNDFLLGGSDMGTFPMAMSLAASFVTAIELLGNPAEMYTNGTQFWMICICFLLIIPLTSKFYLPVYMKLRLTSSYEYLNLRFNHHCRLLASFLYMLQMVLYTSVAVYAPALALSHVTGLNTYIAVTLVYIVCIFYASQGGMKAVIMTDTFQAAVLMGSLFLILGMGIFWTGGMSRIWADNLETGRMQFFNMNPDPTKGHNFWSVVIGGTFYWLTMFCSNQASIQKYLSVESISQVRSALWVSSLGLILIYTINFLTGMVLFSEYRHCDPVATQQITGQDELLPFYVMEKMSEYKGIPGFFVAGIFAASLGTVASAMNSLAAITCEDILQGIFKMEITPSKGACYAKCISVFFGILSFALIFVVERLGGVLQVALSFNGMVGGVTLGLFTLGMCVPWANAKGALVGSITSLALVAWIGLGAQVATVSGKIHLETKPLFTDNCSCLLNTTMPIIEPVPDDDGVLFIYKINYLWYSAIGCMTTVLVGTLVSYLTGFQDPMELDQDLLSPPIRSLLTLDRKSSPATLQGITNLSLDMDSEKSTDNIKSTNIIISEKF